VKIKTLITTTMMMVGFIALIIAFLFITWPDTMASATGIGPLEPSRVGTVCAVTVTVIVMLGWFVDKFFQKSGKSEVRLRWRKNRDENTASDSESETSPGAGSVGWDAGELITLLRFRYGRLWRKKVRILLVTGDEQQIDAVVPGLTAQRWQEGDGVVLLYGGAAGTTVSDPLLQSIHQLSPRRPLDAIVQVMSDNDLPGSAELDETLRQRQKADAILGWQVPVYLWVLDTLYHGQKEQPASGLSASSDNDETRVQSGQEPDPREAQSVGALFPAHVSPALAMSAINGLIPELRVQGMAQLLNNNQHAYLLALSQQLRGEWGKKLQTILTTVLQGPSALLLRGVMFSQPIAAKSAVDHTRIGVPEWRAVTEDCGQFRGRKKGLPWFKGMQVALLTGVVLWGVGTLMSLGVNYKHIVSSQSLSAAAGDERQPLAERLRHQLALQQRMGKLQYQEKTGAPWYSRFGLNQNRAQLTALWPLYQHNSDVLLRDGAAEKLHQHLTAFVQLPPASPERNAKTQETYNQLKAYLMMAHPDKADADFFSKTLIANWQQREGVPVGQWRDVGTKLAAFWSQNLPEHSQWKIEPDKQLVTAVRQILLKQIGQRNAEATLYQDMLKRVANQYPDMSLADMVGDTDPELLFGSDEVVPGMFTRQAWEEQVEDAIEQIASARRAEIDWVLTSKAQPASADITPEALKARLTERYFTDFGNAWLNMLNSLHWQVPGSLSDAIGQLTLLADSRQSPVVALMNTLAWQGKTGQKGEALADTIVDSAKSLMKGKKSRAVIEQVKLPKGPLDATFGPLIGLLDSKDGAVSNGNLSFQAYLTRVAQVRLKLQQVTSAPDPQAMTQMLAQTVFQGKAVDMADTRDYGSLVAASLGQEWSGFGQAVFVQPLELSWRQVLQPAAGSLNAQWQQTIVDQWNTAFAGRYPFLATGSDASLPLLASYLRNDSGRIAMFLKTRLGGVLHQEGNHWVVDPIASQGLNVDPAFLTAINKLTELSDIAFSQGDAGLHFELMARPSRNVARTQLNIDEQDLDYFNQMESWQSISWPGKTYYPGAQLKWRNVKSGMQLYGDYRGNWGFIRLLAGAKVTVLDSSRYQLVWKTTDGNELNYVLRSELGRGPLALLTLQGFRLPKQIFTDVITSPMNMVDDLPPFDETQEQESKPAATNSSHLVNEVRKK
jgi:type VI secretion system protein ImpL